MFPVVLAFHSLLRWLILLSIVLSIIFAYRGYKSRRPFRRGDNYLRLITVSLVHIQLLLGGWLYWRSAIVSYFLANYSRALHQTQARFFGMEHITMMVIGVGLVTLGSSIARRKKDPRAKFWAILLWYSIALIVIFLSIPWAFSPFTARPYFRPF